MRDPIRGLRARRFAILSCLCLYASVVPNAFAAEGSPTYERDIKPLFARRCTVCHNARKRDEPDVSAGLALDRFEAVLSGTEEHKVVEPGRPDRSEP